MTATDGPAATLPSVIHHSGHTDKTSDSSECIRGQNAAAKDLNSTARKALTETKPPSTTRLPLSRINSPNAKVSDAD